MALGFDVSVDNLVVSPNLIHGIDNYRALRMIENTFPYCSATEFLKGVFGAWFRCLSDSADFDESVYDMLTFYCPPPDVSIIYSDVEELIYGILDSIEQKILGVIGTIYPIDDCEFMCALSLDSVYVDMNTVMFTMVIPSEYR